MGFMSLLGSLIPIAIVAGIGYAIVSATRNRQDRSSGRSGAIAVRRLFQYGLLLAVLAVAAFGVGGLLERVLSDAAARRGSNLSGPLALTVVGLPVYWMLAQWSQRQLASDRDEAASLGWSLYLNVALIASLVTGVTYGYLLASGVIDGRPYDGSHAAGLIVAAAIWGAHWQWWRRYPPQILASGHVLVGAAVGLGFMAAGAGFVIMRALDAIFDALGGVAAAAASSESLAKAAVSVGIGAVVWSWHWLMTARHNERTPHWNVYVVLVGVLGGSIAAVIGAATALFALLVWVVGDPGASSLAAHFQDATPAFAAGLVGVAVWRYHKSVLGLAVSRVRTGIDRVYDYVVSGVALATTAGAITTLVVALFEVMTGDAAASSGDSDINIVLGAVTLLIVGAPMWWIAWRRAQLAVARDKDVEAGTTPRRAYLSIVFGVGGAVAFGALIRLLIVLFEAVFDEGRGAGIAGEISVPVGLLVTTGIIAAYHWSVFRAEKTIVVPLRAVTLVWAGNGDVGLIAERAHATIRVMRRVDENESVPSVDAIVAAIGEAQGDELVVLAGSDGVRVVPVSSR